MLLLKIRVLPTHVGMSRIAATPDNASASAPHTRGDEPRLNSHFVLNNRCSPHTWG